MDYQMIENACNKYVTDVFYFFRADRLIIICTLSFWYYDCQVTRVR